MKATIPTWSLFSWESQAKQFPKKGKPGLRYERHFVPSDDDPRWPVDCLVYRNRKGEVVGILYHYPDGGGDDLEQPGNVNIWVRPDRQRRGIGTKLALEAGRRWEIDPEQQRYTEAGLALARRMIKETTDG